MRSRCPECGRTYVRWQGSRIAIHSDTRGTGRAQHRVCSWECARRWCDRVLALKAPPAAGEESSHA